MENNGETYISISYTKNDFKTLQLTVDSDTDKWETAINIFDDRIKGRFFDPITILIGNSTNNINANGFAIMALNCLLVETLAQFNSGKNDNNGQSKSEYVDFLCNKFSYVFDDVNKANVFYNKIRCGILHSAQTKKKTRLTCDDTSVISMSNNYFSVSVLKFTGMLRDYYERYKTRLLDINENELRFNFIKKMNYICNK